MDNLINTAMPGLLSAMASADVTVNAAGIAMQWQLQLVSPAVSNPGMPETPEIKVHLDALDTSMTRSLQQLQEARSLQSDHTAQISAFSSPAELMSLQSVLSYDVFGRTTLTDSRLLGWGNAGQGVLSYLSAYSNTERGATGQQHDVANTANAALTNPSNLSPVLQSVTGMPHQTPIGQPVAASASTRQLAQQHKDNINTTYSHTKSVSGYDITPQALFFVLIGQQGFRATVRDYFNKEDTIKRLYQIQQDSTFAFNGMQQIWLNGKPLHEHSGKEPGYAG
jgi:hypothetical protein